MHPAKKQFKQVNGVAIDCLPSVNLPRLWMAMILSKVVFLVQFLARGSCFVVPIFRQNLQKMWDTWLIFAKSLLVLIHTIGILYFNTFSQL